MSFLKLKSPINIVFIFATFHFAFFLTFLHFFRPIPGIDIAENYFWGMNFEWGYYKHPPLFAWVQEAFGKLFGISVFTAYLTAQFFIFITLISTFFLAKELVGENKALMAILLLEALSFAGINARTFNGNLVQVPFWVLSSLFYLYGIKYQKSLYFILFGAFLGLAFLGKYFALLLGFVIFVSFISNKETRNLLKTHLPYLSVFTFILIILPHIIWLIKSGFMPLKYIMEWQDQTCSFLECRAKFGMKFFILSIASILPVIISFILIYKNFKFKGINLTDPQSNFLFCISVSPFLITSVVSIFTGMFIVVKWSAPFFFFLPIFIFYFWKIEQRKHLKKNLFTLLFALFAIWGSIIIISGKKDLKEQGRHYKLLTEIALKHGDLWEKEIGKKLKVVAGDTRSAGTFSMIAKERPKVLPLNNLKFASYLNEEILNSEGYILLAYCIKDCTKSELGDVKDVVPSHIKTQNFYLQVIYIKPKL